jgi:hypothetical protein
VPLLPTKPDSAPGVPEPTRFRGTDRRRCRIRRRSADVRPLPAAGSLIRSVVNQSSCTNPRIRLVVGAGSVRRSRSGGRASCYGGWSPVSCVARLSLSAGSLPLPARRITMIDRPVLLRREPRAPRNPASACRGRGTHAQRSANISVGGRAVWHLDTSSIPFWTLSRNQHPVYFSSGR